MKYFVWVKGLCGPEAQIWVGDQYEGGKVTPYIFKRKLEPYEENLDLDTLSKFYANEARL